MKIAQVRIDAFKAAMDYIRFHYGWVAEVCSRNNPFMDTQMVWGVNWSCAGTVDTQETQKAIKQMQVCAKIADTLNALNITEDWRERFDDLITGVDEFDKYVREVVEYIMDEKIDKIEAFFTAINKEEYEDMILEW